MFGVWREDQKLDGTGLDRGDKVMVDEDLTVTMAEGTIEINGWKATGIRLYSLALIVLIPFVISACLVAYKTGDISALKELALVIVAFFFGKKA
jgi:hypothetical protein